MVIRESTPLTLIEVADLVGEGERAEKIKDFVKKFVKMDVKKVKEMKEEFMKLEIL